LDNELNSKNLRYYSIGRVIATGIQGAFYLIFAYILDPRFYGELSYFIALAAAVATVSRFGLTHTVIVYQAKKYSILSNQANVFVLLTASVASIILLFINPYSALFCLATSFFMMNQFNLIGLRKYKHYMMISLLNSGLFITLPIVFYFSFGIPGVLIGMALSNLISSIDYLKSLKKKINHFKDLRTNYKVLVHNFAVESSTTLVRYIDKLLVVPIFGFVLGGLYQFNLQILLFIELLPLSLQMYLLAEESRGLQHKKVTILVILASILFVLLIIFFSPLIIEQIFPKYVEGIFALQIMIISAIPLTFSAILYAKLQSMESTKVGFAAIVRVLSLLGFLALLGSLYDLIGLSIAVLLSAIVNTILLVIFYIQSRN